VWQSVPCIRCGKYKNKGKMIKVTFVRGNAAYGYICKSCVKQEEKSANA